VRPRLSPLDRWSIGYAAFAATAVALRWPSGLPWHLLAASAGLAAAALLAPRARTAGLVGELAGSFYPLLVLVALYTEVGLVNSAVGRSYDGLVQVWEQNLFGGQPSAEWQRAWPWPALSWALHASYLSFYFILVAAPLGLWCRKNRRGARRTALLTMVAFYVCYAAFLVFPVAGPRHALAFTPGPAAEVWPARVAAGLLARGDAWGSAFPSSHVAASLVASASAAIEWRPLGLALLPLALLLSLATVYGQYHYAVDALAGAAVALAMLLLRERIVAMQD
jgi:membrane-associated phospholipid phosphatase